MLNPEQIRRPIAAPAALVLASLVLSGCAPLEWQKSGIAEEDLMRDQTRCTADARSTAMRQRAPLRGPPQVVVDPQGRVVAVKPASPDTERFALEQDLIRRCMHDLGYELKQKTAPTTP